MGKNVLSFDFGASSGRAVMSSYDGQSVQMKEIHRFENDPIRINGHLSWDIDLLFKEVMEALKMAVQNYQVDSIGVDTWGADFGLINEKGELITNPVHYRDQRTNGMIDEVAKTIPVDELYQLTGNQILNLNTIFQLAYLNKYEKETLYEARAMLLTPDLFNYLLTGIEKSEITIASTTQLLDPYKHQWNEEIIRKLGFPREIFQDLIFPGNEIGLLSKDLAERLGIPQIPVVSTTSHDTASAVVSVPALYDDFLFVSCGTWSLVGTELKKPMISDTSLTYNLTNESGYGGTTRFLKNVTGLWLLQETMKEFEHKGKVYTYKEITDLASEAEPFKCLLDPDYEEFQVPGNMPKKIQEYAKKTNQSIPETDGEIFRTIYESLALKYRFVFEEITTCVEKEYKQIHMVGGGSKAEILCQMVADATNMEVIAGPVEAAVIGNSLTQFISRGELANIHEARKTVKHSFDVKNYKSENFETWDDVYPRYKRILKSMIKS